MAFQPLVNKLPLLLSTSSQTVLLAFPPNLGRVAIAMLFLFCCCFLDSCDLNEFQQHLLDIPEDEACANSGEAEKPMGFAVGERG